MALAVVAFLAQISSQIDIEFDSGNITIEIDSVDFCDVPANKDDNEIPWHNIDTNPIGTVFEVIILLYCFVGMAVICDDYLAVGLETLCRRWNVKEDVAGATFMAIGSAAPEIVINIIAAFSAGNNPEATKLGVSAIIGSGMVAFLLAPGLCAIFSSKPLLLKRNPLIRDVVAYLVAVISLIFVISNNDDGGKITVGESCVLLAIFVVYVLVTVLGPKFKKWVKAKATSNSKQIPGSRLQFVDADIEEEDDDVRMIHFRDNDFDSGGIDDDMKMIEMDSMLLEESSDVLALNKEDEDDDDDGSPFWLQIISWPLRMLFMITTPNASEGASLEKLYFVTVIVSFGWVAVFSFLIMSLITNWSHGVPVILLGASVVALGGEIPDTIQSISVARRGFGQMAVANCVGSKIVNIGVGLGLTWIVSAIANGKAVQVCDHVKIAHMAYFHTGAILLFFLLTVVASIIEGQKRPTLGKIKGWILVLAYFILMGSYTGFFFAIDKN